MSLLILGQVLFMIPYVFNFFIVHLICVITGMLQNMNINN